VRELMARVIRWLTPWYSDADAQHREESTEAVRQRSITARKRAESVIADYRAADDRLGRMSGR
jgi:hypothetical protein